LLFVALTSFTGTLTSPKPTVPDQIALGIPLGSHVVPVPSNSRGSGPSKTVIEVEGAGGTPRQLTLSNLDKLLYPEAGFTKAAVVDYYARVAPVLLPHLRDRAVTMVRYPDGVDGGSFFEKRCPAHAPEWVRAADVDGIHACVIDDLATLVWVANLAALELHLLQATATHPDEPTAVVLDLDPGPPATIVDCCRVGLDLRGMLDRLGLQSVVKTSGSKGLHLSAGIHGASADETKDFARALGQLLATHDPERVTIVMERAERSGKVFVDWSQNDRHKTTVAPYSLRARPRPQVSTPVAWDEVTAVADGADPASLVFEAADVLERVDRLGDLYAQDPTAQQLPALA
jgi:bifunctional non-homologous end joining protein LigD